MRLEARQKDLADKETIREFTTFRNKNVQKVTHLSLKVVKPITGS